MQEDDATGGGGAVVGPNFEFGRSCGPAGVACVDVGAWLSLVEHSVLFGAVEGFKSFRPTTSFTRWAELRFGPFLFSSSPSPIATTTPAGRASACAVDARQPHQYTGWRS